MKVKIFALVAAFFMLMGGSAWAQADVKGDVNKDGVVNEQDIAAILAIMAKNNGVAEKTKYYWYVGQENPSSIDTSNLKTATNEAGWHLIGTSTSGFTLTFNNQNLIEFEDEGKYYLIIPTSLNVYAADGSTALEGKSLLPIECKISNHKAYEYYTTVYEVKGLVIK